MFRRAVSTNKVEEMLPTLVDFATITSSAGPASQPKREALTAFLSAIIDKSSSRFPNSVLTQLRLLTEQLLGWLARGCRNSVSLIVALASNTQVGIWREV